MATLIGVLALAATALAGGGGNGSDAPVTDGRQLKGTIGVFCIDANGKRFEVFANDPNRAPFSECMENVIADWERRLITEMRHPSGAGRVNRLNEVYHRLIDASEMLYFNSP
jgi:hypothetical protein